MNGNIYIITNKVNNKKYVGQTTKMVEERFTQHKHHSIHKDYPLYLAMRKYGLDSFTIENYGSFPITELDTKEEALINELNTFRGAGYNATPGGQSSKVFKFDTEKLIKEYNELGTAIAVSKLYDCSVYTVLDHLRANGVNTSNKIDYIVGYNIHTREKELEFYGVNELLEWVRQNHNKDLQRKHLSRLYNDEKPNQNKYGYIWRSNKNADIQIEFYPLIVGVKENGSSIGPFLDASEAKDFYNAETGEDVSYQSMYSGIMRSIKDSKKYNKEVKYKKIKWAII